MINYLCSDWLGEHSRTARSLNVLKDTALWRSQSRSPPARRSDPTPHRQLQTTGRGQRRTGSSRTPSSHGPATAVPKRSIRKVATASESAGAVLI